MRNDARQSISQNRIEQACKGDQGPVVTTSSGGTETRPEITDVSMVNRSSSSSHLVIAIVVVVGGIFVVGIVAVVVVVVVAVVVVVVAAVVLSS